MDKSILVIDDDRRSLEELADALEDRGYAPVVVAPDDQPEEQFEIIKPELVFLSLSSTRAFGTCEEIRESPDGAIVPIIFVGTGTAWEKVRSPSDALSYGGDYFFRHPLELSKVLAKVQTYVGPGIPREPQALDEGPNATGSEGSADSGGLGSGADTADPGVASPPIARPDETLAEASDALLAKITEQEEAMKAEIESRQREEAERQQREGKAQRALEEKEREEKARRELEELERREQEEREQREREREREEKARREQEEREQREREEKARREQEERERREREEKARREQEEREQREREEKARREQEEREQREREEKARREQEEREQREREEKARREQEERERREREEKARREQEEREQREREREEKARREQEEREQREREEKARREREERERREREEKARREQEEREQREREEKARREQEEREQREREEKARREQEEREQREREEREARERREEELRRKEEAARIARERKIELEEERLEQERTTQERAASSHPPHDVDSTTNGVLDERILKEAVPVRELPGGLRPLSPESGEFDKSFDIATLLHHVWKRQVTGQLELNSHHHQKSVFFERGHPVDAFSSQIYDRMEEYLFREGKITRAQYQEVRIKGLRSPRRIASYLVTEGYLKPDELFEVVRGHLESILFSVFEFEEGGYRYVAARAEEDHRVMLDLHPRAIVSEGIRRKYTLPRLIERVGAPSSLLGPIPGATLDVETLGLGPDDRQVIRLVDGTRNIEDIVFSTGIGAQRVYHVLASLVATESAEVLVRGIEGVNPDGTSAADDIDRSRIREKYDHIRNADYFHILGVSRRATPYEVDRAFDRNRREYSQGRFSEAIRVELEEELTEIEQVLLDARDILSDESLRDAYARNLP